MNIGIQRQGGKCPPSRHTRGRLWSNSLVRAFLVDLTALPTNLPVPPREAARKNALTAPVHRDKHTLERQGPPRRPSRDFTPSAVQKNLCTYPLFPSILSSRPLCTLSPLRWKGGERESDRDRVKGRQGKCQYRRCIVERAGMRA